MLQNTRNDRCRDAYYIIIFILYTKGPYYNIIIYNSFIIYLYKWNKKWKFSQNTDVLTSLLHEQIINSKQISYNPTECLSVIFKFSGLIPFFSFATYLINFSKKYRPDHTLQAFDYNIEEGHWYPWNSIVLNRCLSALQYPCSNIGTHMHVSNRNTCSCVVILIQYFRKL